MIGEPVLGEVVGPDLLAPVARPHLALAGRVACRLLLLQLHLVELGAEHLQRHGTVLELRFLLLALHHHAARLVREPDRGVGGVHALPARSRRSHDVHLDVGGVDQHVHVFGFGHDGDRDGAGVDASLRLGRGNALDAVHARLVFEARVHAFAFEREARVLDAARGVGRRIHQRRSPALALAIAQIHAQYFRGEEARFVAARAGPDLEDDVALVVGVLGKEQDLELRLEAGEPFLDLWQFVLRHLPHVGVGVLEERLVLPQIVAYALEITKGFYQRLELRALLHQRLDTCRVGENGGIAEVGGQTVELVLDLLQLVVHAGAGP